MDKAFSVLERVYRATKIPLRYMDGTGKLALYHRGFEPDCDPVLLDDALRSKLTTSIQAGMYPTVEIEDDLFIYGSFRDEAGSYVVLGPVLMDKASNTSLSEFAKRHGIAAAKFSVVLRSMSSFIAVLALAAYIITGQALSETDIVVGINPLENEEKKDNDFQAYLLGNAEQETARFSYNDEREFMRPIQEGHPEEISDRTDVADAAPEKVGRQAVNPYKQHEYNCCSTITLSTRAAIQGGLDPLMAYAIADMSKQKLEKCGTISDILKLQRDVMVELATRVRQVLETKRQSSYVEQCKSYINNHLNSPFRLEDVAEKIGINKSYLSRRFSQTEGIGIQKYTQFKRLEAAANMLKYSDESLTTISSYLCFPSQSYFGQIFKDTYGETPQKYRNREKLTEIY
ncbi:MAG: helix-turn-helix transcriptional regulator [Oscillospiraceae bacterium]